MHRIHNSSISAGSETERLDIQNPPKAEQHLPPTKSLEPYSHRRVDIEQQKERPPQQQLQGVFVVNVREHPMFTPPLRHEF